jgi:hypothetical protein
VFGLMIGIVSWLRRRTAWLVPAVVALGLLGGSPAAQELSASERAELSARKEALFQETLRNPGNLDITFAYADVSAKLGDNEAAVAALERMLLFNPNLPRVQLELGALYFRMGSYELSRSYFDKALAANPPDEVKSRIRTYLGEISRLSGERRFSGYFSFGGQYQSDANLAPGSPLISSQFFGIPTTLTLNPDFVKRPDENFFATGGFLYSIDLGNQDRDAIEIGGLGFANHYGVVTRLDLGLAEATVGPRFNYTDPLPQVTGASLKPYFITNDVSLGGNQYFHTVGVGGEATAVAFDDLRLRAVFEFRDKNFNDAPDRPLSRGLNGTDKLLSLFASKQITSAPASELALEFDFLAQDTRLAYYANKTYAGSVAYRIRYDDPTRTFHFPWETTLFLTRASANYAAPDPCCNTSSNPVFFVPGIRADNRWRIGMTQSFKVSEDVAFLLQVQRDIVSSNLSLYGYTSNSVLFGPHFRF